VTSGHATFVGRALKVHQEYDGLTMDSICSAHEHNALGDRVPPDKFFHALSGGSTLGAGAN
jgi:hypothetical protein